MLNITITEQTPDDMLRAIRAACNELLGDMPAERQVLNDENATQHVTEASHLSRYSQGGPIPHGQVHCVGAREAQQMAQDFREAHPEVAAAFQEANDIKAAMADAQSAPETDSTGTEWNPELHASTKAKNQDGTWKRRRGAGQNVAAIVEKQEQQLGIASAPSLPPLPPTPPAPATTLVTMNDIYALITNGKAVLNDVIAAAQAMGFADVGAFSRDATPEQRAQLLAQLTKEVA